MKRLCCFLFLVWASVSLYAQVEPTATGGPVSLDDTAMMTPPPVSGGAYSLEGGRSNYLNVGLVVTPAYTDNVYSGSARKVGDEQYSFQPTLVLDTRSARQNSSIAYSPGFTFYQHTSALSGMTQQGSAGYQYYLTKYATINVGDSFYQNSNLYNQQNPFAPGTVNASAEGAGIFPFANLISNSSHAGINYQYAKNAMIGASGSFLIDRYSNLGQNDNVQPGGLQDQNATGASAFFSRRLTRAHYLGLSYQFSKIITFPVRSYTYTNTAMAFFTVYLTRSFSFSILGGSQHYDTSDQTGLDANAWTPALQGSVGWQGKHAGVAASYSRVVSNAAGLLGVYHTNAFDVGTTWQLARKWSLNGGGGYSRYDLVRLTGTVPSQETTTGFGSATLTRALSERLSAALTYAHFHQDSGFGFAVPFPESNRISLSMSYAFSRPLGR